MQTNIEQKKKEKHIRSQKNFTHQRQEREVELEALHMMQHHRAAQSFLPQKTAGITMATTSKLDTTT